MTSLTIIIAIMVGIALLAAWIIYSTTIAAKELDLILDAAVNQNLITNEESELICKIANSGVSIPLENILGRPWAKPDITGIKT